MSKPFVRRPLRERDLGDPRRFNPDTHFHFLRSHSLTPLTCMPDGQIHERTLARLQLLDLVVYFSAHGWVAPRPHASGESQLISLIEADQASRSSPRSCETAALPTRSSRRSFHPRAAAANRIEPSAWPTSCWQYQKARSPYFHASRQRIDDSPTRNEPSGNPAV